MMAATTATLRHISINVFESNLICLSSMSVQPMMLRIVPDEAISGSAPGHRKKARQARSGLLALAGSGAEVLRVFDRIGKRRLPAARMAIIRSYPEPSLFTYLSERRFDNCRDHGEADYEVYGYLNHVFPYSLHWPPPCSNFHDFIILTKD